MAFSTIQGGTLGFMPPEQIHNHKLTEASDLYGLGATIVCLITQTKSQNIGSLVDFSSNKINFKEKASKYSFRFIQWLEKMVEPDPKKRFTNAKLALEAFEPLYVIRIPELHFTPNSIQLEAQKLGQKLQFDLNISNTIPETILQGNLSIVEHPSDYHQLLGQVIEAENTSTHTWITLNKTKFKGNNIQCQVTLDTGNLRAQKLYERELRLTSNATDKAQIIPIKLKTAPIPIEKKNIPYLWLCLLLSASLMLPFQISLMQQVWWRVTGAIESIWEWK
jgi:serine/threonine protein kinase